MYASQNIPWQKSKEKVLNKVLGLRMEHRVTSCEAFVKSLNIIVQLYWTLKQFVR